MRRGHHEATTHPGPAVDSTPTAARSPILGSGRSYGTSGLTPRHGQTGPLGRVRRYLAALHTTLFRLLDSHQPLRLPQRLLLLGRCVAAYRANAGDERAESIAQAVGLRHMS